MRNKKIAVIGAGAFGSWIALLAAQAGFETVLLEQHSPANDRSSSTGTSRIMRRTYGNEELYTVFAERSRKKWLSFFASENRPSCFRRTGVLWMANGNDSSLIASRTILSRNKILHEFLEAPAIRKLCCGMEVPPGTVGIFEPDSGALMAEESIRLVVDAATREGAVYLKAKAMPVVPVSNLRSLEIENSDPIKADLFVFACGSWLPKLFPDLLGHRIVPTRQELFFFELPIGWATHGFNRLPIWVDQVDPRTPYGVPESEDNQVKIAFHRAGPKFDPEFGDRQVLPTQIREAADYIRGRFPGIQSPVFRYGRVCHYENTPNQDFLIDRHPLIRNVWFAAGGSGHGFKHAPAVAEYLIEALAKGYSQEPRFHVRAIGNRKI